MADILGTLGNDTLLGTADPDKILGRDGADEIRGLAGDDILFGQIGNDTLYGGRGNDRIDGGPGDDLIFGGRGNDDVRGGEGNDIVHGGAGDDVVGGGNGYDVLSGGRGSDMFDLFSGDTGGTRIKDLNFCAGDSLRVDGNSGLIIDSEKEFLAWLRDLAADGAMVAKGKNGMLVVTGAEIGTLEVDGFGHLAKLVNQDGCRDHHHGRGNGHDHHHSCGGFWDWA